MGVSTSAQLLNGCSAADTGPAHGPAHAVVRRTNRPFAHQRSYTKRLRYARRGVYMLQPTRTQRSVEARPVSLCNNVHTRDIRPSSTHTHCASHRIADRFAEQSACHVDLRPRLIVFQVNTSLITDYLLIIYTVSTV